jgi:hypothetical protein
MELFMPGLRDWDSEIRRKLVQVITCIFVRGSRFGKAADAQRRSH